ncbi:MAG: hypothetical protein IJR71_00405 [Prevotella sp.]|nr:hypothetical protein [Prevotella sp.]
MKLENLKKAEELADKLRKMKRCHDLLQGGGTVKVYGSADIWEAIPDHAVKEALRQSILNRMSEIKKEVESL